MSDMVETLKDDLIEKREGKLKLNVVQYCAVFSLQQLAQSLKF